LPALAIHYWFDELRPHRPPPESLNSPADVNALIEALEAKLDFVAPYILSWGKLLRAAPEREIELRVLLKRAASMPFPKFFPLEPIHPYRVDLEQELVVLPVMAAALTERFSRFDWRPAWDGDTEGGNPEHLVAEFGLIPARLYEIVQQSQQEADVRSAALILYLLQIVHGKASPTEPNQLLATLSPLIIELYSERVSRWYLTGVRIFLDRICNENDVEAVDLLGRLFERAREDYRGRQTLHELLAKWRERSSAPVHAANVQQAWLEQ
jgi:hypothetical protein